MTWKGIRELTVREASWVALYQSARKPEPEKELEMVSFSSMSESKFLKKEDLDQVTGNLVTITGFKKQKVDDEGDEPEYKFTVKFREFEKPMVLNATNRAILERTYGPDTDDCIGKPIVVYVDENVSFGGKLVGGIRMRAPRRAAAPPPVAAPIPVQTIPATTNDFDDDIPF